MAIRVPWDIREAAVLLQALISVLNNKEGRKRAIAEVSQTLRKLAVRQGFSVDDQFRNENGIALQISKLEYAFTNGKIGTACTDRIVCTEKSAGNITTYCGR